MNILDTLTDEQKAVVSRIQRAVSALNSELRAAMAAGVQIKIDTTSVEEWGLPARGTVVTAKLTLPEQSI